MERMNIIATGGMPPGSALNPLAAALPDKCGPLSGVRLFNALLGGCGPCHFGNRDSLLVGDWNVTALNGAGSGGVTVVTDAEGLGAHYRITTPAVADDGWQAILTSDRGGTNKQGVFALPKSDENKPIHGSQFFRFNDLTATFAFGLVLPAEATILSGTSELSGGGAAKFVGLWHDGDSDATGLAGVFKNASGDTFTFADVQLQRGGSNIALAIDTWYEAGFRVLDKRAGVQFWVRELGAAWDAQPNFTVTVVTDLPEDTEELQWGVACTSSDGGAVTFDFTYPVCIQERGVFTD